MGRQSSRVYWGSKDHKDVFWGKYTKAVYIGSQLIWEKLEDTGKYKWIPYIYSYAIHNDETYMYAKVESTAFKNRRPYLCKWNKDKRKIEIVKALDTRKYSYALSSTPYYLGLYIKENSTDGNPYIIDYDFADDTEIIKIEENTLEHPINIWIDQKMEVYTKNTIVNGCSIQTEEWATYLMGLQERKYGESIADRSVIYSVKMTGTISDTVYFQNRYVRNCLTSETRTPVMVSSDVNLSVAEGVSLVDEEKQKKHHVNFRQGFLIHDGKMYIAGYRSIDSLQRELEIFCYNGSELKIAKRLGTSYEYLGEINYIDGVFVVFTSGLLYSEKYFFVGKSIETLEKIEYEGSGSACRFGVPISDGENIYVSVLETNSESTDWYSGTNFYKIDKEKLEIAETVNIESFNLNEEV